MNKEEIKEKVNNIIDLVGLKGWKIEVQINFQEVNNKELPLQEH